MKLKHTRLFSFSLMTMLLFVACQSETKPTITTSPVVTVTSTTISQSSLEITTTVLLPTATSIIKIEMTSDPRFASTALPSLVPTTVTPLPTLPVPTIAPATLTPLPTLASNELKTAVEELLANPMNCDIPCWWGSVPGTTTISDIKHTLAPYNFDIYEYEVDGKIYLRLGIGRVEERNDFEVKIVYSFSDSILTGVTAYTPSISDILAKHGQPDEVWLSAMNDPREQPPLIWFIIVYLQKGIGIGYVVDGDSQGDMILGCVANEDTERLRSLRLVIPDSATDYKDFPSIFDQERLYLPLEEATSLTTEDFMQLFNDPTQLQCIETSTELWD